MACGLSMAPTHLFRRAVARFALEAFGMLATHLIDAAVVIDLAVARADLFA